MQPQVSKQDAPAGFLGIEWSLGARAIPLPRSADGTQRKIFAASPAESAPTVLAGRTVTRLLKRHRGWRDRVGLVINASFAPADFALWSLAAWVQAECGLRNAVAYDLYQGCVGFLQGLHIAARAVESGEHEAAIVFASEWFEHLLPFRRARGQHWSDGAAAVLVTRMARKSLVQVVGAGFATDGRFVSLTRAAAGNRRGARWGGSHPMRYRYFATKLEWEAFIVARDSGYRPLLERTLRSSRRRMSDVSCILQNNILPPLPERMKLRKKIPTTLDPVPPLEGHAGATDIPRALARGLASGRFKQGDVLALMTGGIGWSWGCMLVQVPPSKRSQ
jgi:3-oxoacyl-[acyl-carrier-protein] synthase III